MGRAAAALAGAGCAEGAAVSGATGGDDGAAVVTGVGCSTPLGVGAGEQAQHNTAASAPHLFDLNPVIAPMA